MSIKDDGGSAFPLTDHFDEGNNYKCAEGGMSLRDYFAAKAVIGLIENSAGDHEWLAKQAYAAADAMLKERAK